MKLNLKNKKILITGSSKGIGLEIAKDFSNLGNEVFINSRSTKNLISAKKYINNSNLITCQADLSEELGIKKLFKQIRSKTKHLDILVCNLGNSTPQNTIGEEDLKNWQSSINVNLLSAVNTIYHFRKLLKNSSSPSIVCISSICGVSSLGAPIDYSVAKSALISFVKNQSRILSNDGIAPGNILFKGGTWEKKLKNNKNKVNKYIKNNVPLNMFGSTKHISAMALFLSSDVSSFTTGANIIIDGGQTA